MAGKSKPRKKVQARKTKSDEPVLTPSQLSEIQNELVLPYKELRVTIGLLGMLMPLILYVGGRVIFGKVLQESISAYYHTGMRDVMVGILFAMGVFLFSYKGYGHADDIAGNLACLFAIGTALFPTLRDGETGEIYKRISVVHHIFAASFLLSLTYFCLVLFTKSKHKPADMSDMKKLRNTVYRVCGGVMLASILLIAIYFAAFGAEGRFLGITNPIYWLETLAIFAFGFSWFVKSEVILKDKEEPPMVKYVPQFVEAMR